MSNIPEETHDDEIDITWKADTEGVKISVKLGGAKITVRATADATESLGLLVMALPQAIEAAWMRINEDLSEEEK